MDNQPKQSSQTPQPAPVPASKAMADKVHVVVRNRQKIIFEDDAKSVSSTNDTGKFDILPEHANFISVINESITVHKLDGQNEVIALKNGVLKVKQNTVHAYIDLLSAEAEAKAAAQKKDN